MSPLSLRSGRALFASLILVAAPAAFGQSTPSADAVTEPAVSIPPGLLAPVRTSSPRATLQTFLDAMNDYRRGLERGDPALRARIDDAVQTLNLSHVDFVTRQAVGWETVVLLKEVIDRVAVIDLNQVPNGTEAGANGASTHRWAIEGTDIAIARVAEGEQSGAYLFTPETVTRIRSLFDRVESLPYLPGSGGGAGFERSWLERNVPDWTNDVVFGLRIWQWIGLFVAVLLGLTARAAVRGAAAMLKRFAARTAFTWDETFVGVLTNPASLLVAVGLWFVCLFLLRLDGVPFILIKGTLQLLLGIGLVWLVHNLADVAGSLLRSRTHHLGGGRIQDQLIVLITRSLKVFVIIFGTLVTAQNLGFNVFSLLAGVGIGGLAIALAAQDAVANFFGSLMILFDRSFELGDWIKVDGQEGIVEDIGFRSTRIRTFYDSVISIPNGKVASAMLDNMGRRRFRRVMTTLGVTYDTPPERIEAFLEGIKQVILANPRTRKDNFHVVLNNFGPSNLEILVYFFLEVPNWAEELVDRHHVFLEIIRLADAMGVRFAFPTQTVHVETFPGHDADADASQPLEPSLLAHLAQAFGPRGERARPGGSGLFTPPCRDGA